ncbi:MAG: CBS domain-containing protein [Nanoarchaeota archaeon]
MKIKEVMNRAVAVDHDISVKEAARIMSDKNIGSVVALKKGKIMGIVTEKDIIRNVENINKKISSIMSRNVVTIEQDEDLDEAAILMKKNCIKRLPVTKDGELVGIITSTDMIANSDELNEEFLFD